MQVDGRSSAPWDRVVPLFRSAPHAPQPFARELGTLLPYVPATLDSSRVLLFCVLDDHYAGHRRSRYRRAFARDRKSQFAIDGRTS